ncbi:obg [Symbiodinium sp. KB8]|nr:obg [Symbiodinium sp. KB8]
MLVARGGAGGLGNASFRRDEDWPETPHIAGEPGQLRFLELELKVLADIGLVGFPNAGKSSLLASMSAAQPKVADYPFTTLSPVMGVLRFGDGSSLRVADVPGLITGASEDRGSDIAAGQEEGADEGGGVDRLRGPRPSEAGLTPSQRRVRRAVDDLAALQEELRAYNPALLARPALVVANKTDLPGTQNTVEALRQATMLPVVAVSALQRAGLPLLVRSLKWLHDTASQQGGGSGR